MEKGDSEAKKATQAYLAAQGDVEGQLSSALSKAVHEAAPNCLVRVAELLAQSAAVGAAAGAAPASGPLPMLRCAHPANAEVDAWLAKEVAEPVIEPELPIIDSHHHFWDHRVPQPWAMFRTKVYDAAEFAHDIATSGHNVVGTVYVQAGTYHLASGPAEFRPCGEVEYCQGVAAQCESGVYAGPRFCWGVQGYADIRHENATAVLQRMAQCRSFRGVRTMGPYDDAFKRGLALMADRGLVLDRWHMPKNGAADMSELPRLAALAREFPTLTVVLNHLGGLVGPAVANDPKALAQWRAGIEELAGCPNVVCKLGGIQMAANGLGLEKRETPVGSDELLELTSPWYEHAVRTFGAARCLFESNYPVERDCVSYRTLLNMFKKLAAKAGLSEAEKADFFYGTAKRVYGLSDE